MRATLFVQEGPVEVKVIDSSKSHMFVVLELNAVEFFFPGYGQENVDYTRVLIEKLTVAANELQNKVFAHEAHEREMESLISPEPEVHASTYDSDLFDQPTRKLTTTERHQLQADNGQDTIEEARGER